MIDSDKIKEFWDNRASKANKLRVEGVANLEENSKLLDKKISIECDKIMEWVDLSQNDLSILDLGSGAGQWTFRFAKTAKRVVAVEYSKGMLDLAIRDAKKQKLSNIEFIQKPAQNYISTKKYDFIWISGLLIYLNDNECETLVRNCKNMLKETGKLILRDGTGINNRYLINNKYSKDLDSYYSACYRTRNEYKVIFKASNFNLIRDEDMFEEKSCLNKWKETRLRVYEFRLNRN